MMENLAAVLGGITSERVCCDNLLATQGICTAKTGLTTAVHFLML